MSDMAVKARKQQIPEWTLGDRLRKAREAAGFPRQEDMEPMVFAKRNTISNWERNTHRPGELALQRWAEVTRVPYTWLAYGVDDDGDEGNRVTIREPATVITLVAA